MIRFKENIFFVISVTFDGNKNTNKINNNTGVIKGRHTFSSVNNRLIKQIMTFFHTERPKQFQVCNQLDPE